MTNALGTSGQLRPLPTGGLGEGASEASLEAPVSPGRVSQGKLGSHTRIGDKDMQIDGYIRGFGVTWSYTPHRDRGVTVSRGKAPWYSPVYGTPEQYRYQMEFYATVP